MDHSEKVSSISYRTPFHINRSIKGPLPIPIVDLGKSAQDVKAYAKALRYKELEIRNIGVGQ